VVDISDGADDPARAVETIEQELRAYNPALLSVPRILAANKSDLPHAAGLARLAAGCAGRDLPMVVVSALTGDGIPQLLEALALRLRTSNGTTHAFAQNPRTQ